MSTATQIQEWRERDWEYEFLTILCDQDTFLCWFRQQTCLNRFSNREGGNQLMCRSQAWDDKLKTFSPLSSFLILVFLLFLPLLFLHPFTPSVNDDLYKYLLNNSHISGTFLELETQRSSRKDSWWVFSELEGQKRKRAECPHRQTEQVGEQQKVTVWLPPAINCFDIYYVSLRRQYLIFIDFYN